MKLVVSTTTSLYDTGLLDALEDRFESRYPIDVQFISAGTGIAIKYAENGDADMILVHSPQKEREFLEGGYGVCRKIIAYNFFVVVGPESDPAKIKGLNLKQALLNIIEAGRKGKVIWVSRGDESGTHVKEKNLWSIVGYDWSEIRNEDWYIESGAGMGKTLQITNEKLAYILSDIGTYLKYYSNGLIDLVILVEESKELINVYSAIAVNPNYNQESNFDAAITFIKFLVSEEGQSIIDNYGSEYAENLFYPTVKLLREDIDPTIAEWIREYAYIEGEECPVKYRDNHPELYE